ncbi:transcription regulator [Grosmannia clavigera kw1407]|uniref:Transcription regulator n=1 Tax=Grosmannia clavigera (strain kw1407 / UAMH 11150) TaxID=655863 RepID=F0X952_GROCL|nr:transcription regulator [Grosmannia clavigera kw1407]EFX05929.1 transcription regulator [Grosmannia clavigera kw1407]
MGGSISPEGVDTPPSGTGTNTVVAADEFSWLDPHPIFVIILVGPDERPFGIQKDFLCSKCHHFRNHFAKNAEDAIEHVVRLPETPVQVFAHAQHFLYTGNVFVSTDQMPSYDVLVNIWKLGHSLGIDGLCERTLEAMAEYKRATHCIPDTPLLVQVWKDTPAGSSIRQLLLSWAAEYLRSSHERSEFARSLPQELLSELVVAMSSYGDGVLAAPGPGTGAASDVGPKKNVHYMNGGDDFAAADYSSGSGDRDLSPASKRARHTEYPSKTAASSAATNLAGPGKAGRTSLPNHRMPPKKRNSMAGTETFTADQKLKFCSDLINRMLSGPGFWTRLVGPFRDAVDPVTEGIPDYLDKIKRPMDLSTIKSNLDRGLYRSEDEFLTDMQQIFSNVYTYWKRDDPIWVVCKRLQRTFEEKYAQMNKWLGKMDGEVPP